MQSTKYFPTIFAVLREQTPPRNECPVPVTLRDSEGRSSCDDGSADSPTPEPSKDGPRRSLSRRWSQSIRRSWGSIRRASIDEGLEAEDRNTEATGKLKRVSRPRDWSDELDEDDVHNYSRHNWRQDLVSEEQSCGWRCATWYFHIWIRYLHCRFGILAILFFRGSEVLIFILSRREFLRKGPTLDLPRLAVCTILGNPGPLIGICSKRHVILRHSMQSTFVTHCKQGVLQK